jgi:uncharacterized protein YecE (DUF72 family)
VKQQTFGKKHDNKLKARAWTRISISRRIRYAIEVRHDSFMTPEFFALLRKHNIAFVFADTAGKWPYAEHLTADFNLHPIAWRRRTLCQRLQRQDAQVVG